MATISVPLTPELERFIQEQIELGNAENKAQVVRHALRSAAESAALTRVLAARQEVAEGKIIRGTLDEILGL